MLKDVIVFFVLFFLFCCLVFVLNNENVRYRKKCFLFFVEFIEIIKVSEDYM